VLGVERLVLGVHDLMLPSLPGEDTGRGSPLSRGAREFVDFGLGLVIPVNAAPGPGVAGSRLFGHNHDTTQLSWGRVSKTAGLFACRRLERRDRLVLHIHHEVVTVESVPVDLVALEGQGNLQRADGSAGF